MCSLITQLMWQENEGNAEPSRFKFVEISTRTMIDYDIKTITNLTCFSLLIRSLQSIIRKEKMRILLI